MVIPVILCGGSGTRLWPLSRKSYPEQFVPLVGERTLFEVLEQRARGQQFLRSQFLFQIRFQFGNTLATVVDFLRSTVKKARMRSSSVGYFT